MIHAFWLRTIRALVAIALLAASAACASGGSGNGGQEPQKLKKSAELDGSITVWSWDVAAAALKRLSTDFEAKNPGTEIKVVDTGYDNAYDKISVGLQAGAGLPDLITVESDRMQGYVAQFPNGFVDMSSLVADEESNFDPSKWAASSDANGKLLSLPWDSGTVALYVRRDYLSRAGVDPASLRTWSDVLSAGEKIKTATGKTLMSIDVASGSTFGMLMQQQGAGIFDENGAITVNGPEAVQALTLLKTLNERGLLSNVKGWDGRVTATKSGKSAVHPEAVWWTGTLSGEMPELAGKFQVIPLPGFSAETRAPSNSGGSTLAVPAQADNAQLAGAFAAFVLADADNQVSMMEREGLFPSYLPALNDEFFRKPQPYFNGQPVYELFAEETKDIPVVYYTEDYAKALDIVANGVVAAVMNGEEPQKVLDDAAKQIAVATGRKIVK